MRERDYNNNADYIRLPDKIEVFTLNEEYGLQNKTIILEYIKSKQDCSHCIILTASGSYFKEKDYRIRFMDTQGNTLDNEVDDELDYIISDIGHILKGVVHKAQLELIKPKFKDMFFKTMVDTAFKRKKELIDFYDPQVWQASNNPDVVGLDRMEYLNKVRGFRSKEDNMILEFMEKNPGVRYEEAMKQLNLVHYEDRQS